ncbi:MAG: response regulator [Candidatus Manganitrophus sp.]|nr:response regulator [Candidatus Manganitrophus sp.]
MSAALEGHTWDVILADYRMPNFNALNALSILKEKSQDIPFIIVSGSIGEETATAAMRAGANDYLMKDNLTRLNETVRRELKEAVNRAALRSAEASLRESEEKYRRFFEEDLSANSRRHPGRKDPCLQPFLCRSFRICLHGGSGLSRLKIALSRPRRLGPFYRRAPGKKKT